MRCATNATTNSSLCVDANVIVRALVLGPLSDRAEAPQDQSQRDETPLLAPALLAFEVTSTLHRPTYLHEITPAHADRAFALFQQLDIRLSSRRALFPLARRLAREFNRPRAYDTAYLALAQLAGCDFWTADEPLHNAVAGRLPWVNWLGSFRPTEARQ